MKLESFVEKLKAIYGGNLTSVILYGSAAGEDFQKGYSDYNLMVILKDVSLAEIGKSANLRPPPLFVDRDWLDSSRDVFPIEFSDIKERHKILFGEDPFQTMEIRNDHLRLQCEEQLKGKILALREAFLRATPSHRRLKELLTGSVSPLIAIFRGVLRLLGEPVPATKREVLKRLNERTDFDTSVFDRVLEVREGKRKIGKAEILPWLEEYLTTLKRVAKLVDSIGS